MIHHIPRSVQKLSVVDFDDDDFENCFDDIDNFLSSNSSKPSNKTISVQNNQINPKYNPISPILQNKTIDVRNSVLKNQISGFTSKEIHISKISSNSSDVFKKTTFSQSHSNNLPNNPTPYKSRFSNKYLPSFHDSPSENISPFAISDKNDSYSKSIENISPFEISDKNDSNSLNSSYSTSSILDSDKSTSFSTKLSKKLPLSTISIDQSLSHSSQRESDNIDNKRELEGNTHQATIIQDSLLSFISHRLYTTLLGGLTFHSSEELIPVSFIIISLLLWLYPFIISLIFALLISYQYLSLLISTILASILIVLPTLILSILIYYDKQSETSLSLPSPSWLDEIENDIYDLGDLKSWKFFIFINDNIGVFILRLLLAMIITSLTISYLTINPLSIAICSFFSISSTHFTLLFKPPVESNQLYSNDILLPFQRTPIILIFLIIHFFYPSLYLSILFIFLGFLIGLGILPGPTALFYYLIEQTTVLLGGTSSSTFIKSIVYFTLSLLSPLSILIGYKIPSLYLWPLVISNIISYLLSMNIINESNDISHSKINWFSRSNLYSLFYSPILYLIKFILFLILTFLFPFFISFFSSSWIFPFSFVLISLFLLSQLVSLLFYPYYGFIFSSHFYSKNISSLSFLYPYFNIFYSLLLYLYCLLVFIIDIDININYIYHIPFSFYSFCFMIGYIKMFRSQWQDSHLFKFEITLTIIIYLSTSTYYSFFLLYLLISLSYRYLYTLYSMTFFYLSLTISSFILPKLSFVNYYFVLLSNIAYIPINFISIIFSTLTSSPLMPIMSTPFFIPSSVRPIRFFPILENSFSTDHHTSYYYLSIFPALLQHFSQFFHYGILNSLKSNDFLILRCESYIIWIQIIEKGQNYIGLICKGLELQEQTSCHNVESHSIDQYSSSISSSILFYPHFWSHCYRSRGYIEFPAYNIMDNNIINFIYNKTSLILISTTFLRVLIFIFHQNQTKILSQSRDIDIPFDSSIISQYFNDISQDYLKFIFKEKISSPSKLISMVITCYILCEKEGLGKMDIISAGPSHVYQLFNGDLPLSLSLKWLDDQSFLKQLVIESYRFAFLLVYESVCIDNDQNILTDDDITSYEEFQDKIIEYQQLYHIGPEHEQSYKTSMLLKKPCLFSLSFIQPNKYKCRYVKLSPLSFSIYSLNSSVVQGIWSSLIHELQYCVNDDEERYSIQAHPWLLRNLTISSANNPFGYSIASTGYVTVPI